jgi:hypothetical protein
MAYWNNNGKYQIAYNYFFDKLVPKSGKADDPFGELLSRVSWVYQRRFNDGDTYDDLCEDHQDGLFINNKNMPEKQRKKVEYLIGVTEEDLEKTINYVVKEIMLEHSTDEKIWNPETSRLIRIDTVKGLKILKDFGCKIHYTKN